MRYWFRPARFWKWFAFYYPATWEGWLVTIALIAFGVKVFFLIDRESHSASDTLLAFAPWVIALFALFDLLCFRTGEYPSWWRKK
ncbi:MAG: hypothetical protein ABI747_00535 [Candidatus Moraniibacteriota bacterium]